MGMAANLVTWPGPFEQTFVPPSHWHHMKFDFDCPSDSDEKMFEECGRWIDNDRRTEPAYTISSPMSLKAQVS